MAPFLTRETESLSHFKFPSIELPELKKKTTNTQVVRYDPRATRSLCLAFVNCLVGRRRLMWRALLGGDSDSLVSLRLFRPSCAATESRNRSLIIESLVWEKKKKKKNLSSLADSIGCSGSRHHGLPFASQLIRAACLDDAQAERIEISKKVSNQLLLLVVDDKTRLPRD